MLHYLIHIVDGDNENKYYSGASCKKVFNLIYG